MSTSGGGFAASGLLQGFAQAYTQARIRATQMEVEQRHGLASTLMQLYPNARPEAQADIAQRLLSIYSTPPGKKLDKKISDIGSLGASAAQANNPGASPAGQQAAQSATSAGTSATQGQISAMPPPGATGAAPAPSTPGIPPPPDLGPVASGAGAPGGAVPIQGQTIPAPPAYSPLLSPVEKNQMEAAHITATERAKTQAEIDARRQIADSIPGLTPEQRANVISGHMIIPTSHGQLKTFIGSDGQPVGGFWDPLSKTAQDMNGNVIPNAREWHTGGGFWGKTTPQMAAIGVPPNPLDVGRYPMGQKDPQFIKDVQEYGKRVNDLTVTNQAKIAGVRGESIAYGRAKYMQIPVMERDPETGEPTATYASALQIANNPSAFTPLVEGDKLMMKNAVFEDIKGAAGNLRKAISDNPVQFSAGQIAKMTAAMDADPSGGLLHSSITNLIQAGGKDSLTTQQQAVAIAMQQAYENAYALRSVAGFGSGSDELRRAIRATLPGPSSPKDYALKQLTAFEQQVGRLQRGVVSVPLRNTPPPSSANAPAPPKNAKNIPNPPAGSPEEEAVRVQALIKKHSQQTQAPQ
jgi:hypothetical protein